MTRDELRDKWNDKQKYGEMAYYFNMDYGVCMFDQEYVEHLEDQLLDIYNKQIDDGK